MVNGSNPPGGPTPPNPQDPTFKSNKKPAPGEFSFQGEHKFLHMTFSADEWNQLMNIMAKNLADYISKTMQKMTEKMKKDWKRGSGEEVDD